MHSNSGDKKRLISLEEKYRWTSQHSTLSLDPAEGIEIDEHTFKKETGILNAAKPGPSFGLGNRDVGYGITEAYHHDSLEDYHWSRNKTSRTILDYSGPKFLTAATIRSSQRRIERENERIEMEKLREKENLRHSTR